MYLSIDPGEKIGWATFDSSGKPTGYGEVRGRDALIDLLQEDRFSDVQQLIIEDYRIFGHKAKAHAQSKVETTRVIGAVEAWAKMRGIKNKPVLQPANILPIAQMWSGIPVPSHGAHGHDQWSAYNHGFYYLVKNNIIPLTVRTSDA